MPTPCESWPHEIRAHELVGHLARLGLARAGGADDPHRQLVEAGSRDVAHGQRELVGLGRRCGGRSITSGRRARCTRRTVRRGEHGLRADLAGQLDYGRYLALDELLACQRPISPSHDEMLFIVIHQATELWIKLMLHELDAARGLIAADELAPASR